MKITVLSAAIISIAATFPSLAGSFKRITDETKFRAMFVGNTKTCKHGSQRVHDNGSVSGTITGA